MNRPPVIAVTQRKGGDGKTTIATHLAGGLAREGMRVLLIDTDPQGDAARLLGLPPDDALYRWLAEDAPLTDLITPVDEPAWRGDLPDGSGVLGLIRSSALTAAIASANDNPLALAAGLNDLDDVFDVVVLDTAPTLAPFDAYVKLATDLYLFVTQPEHLSLEGLADGLTEAERMSEIRQQAGFPPSDLLGIVPNKVRANTDVHRYLIAELGKRYEGRVWPPIMLRTLYTQAATFGELIWPYRPDSFEAEEMTKLVQRAYMEVNRERLQ